MLITILSFAFAFIVDLISIKKHNDSFSGTDFGIVIIFGIVTSMVLHLLTIPLTFEFENRIFEKEIVATKPDVRIEGYIGGGLFYTRGKIEDKDYYFVLTKNNGIYKQEKVLVENTVIVETAGKPKVVMDKEYCGGTAWSNWIRIHDAKRYYDERDTIYVPIGTVENNAKFEVF